MPEAADDLEKLAGVGRKTANVIRAVWFGHATMAVFGFLVYFCFKRSISIILCLLQKAGCLSLKGNILLH